MPHIDIQRRHDIGRTAAKRSVEEIAEQLDEEFELHYRWEGEILIFRRSGIHGQKIVNDADVHIQCKLGLLLRPLRGRLEGEIHRFLDEYLT
jgi:putative polyhydroxyalkanoate system protein